MSTTVAFTVPGAPRGKGRPRFARIGAGVRAYTDAETASYENLVAILARDAWGTRPAMQDAVRVVIEQVYARPKTGKAAKRPFPTVRPDADNVQKGILDGLNRSGIWRDDCQVCELIATKRYGEPCCRVTVEAIPQETAMDAQTSALGGLL